jgi:aldehyde:ferredoxin oxidoreductase
MDGVIELIEGIRSGSPLGRLIAAGADAVGAAFGMRRVPTVKHQSMAGYDPRTILGMGVGYATSPMGADHTACFAPIASVFALGEYVDPLDPVGQVEYARSLQINAAMLDSLGLCSFVSFPLAENPAEGLKLLATMVGHRWQRECSPEDLLALGREVLTAEVQFNRAAGLGKEQDRLPEFFTAEPVAPLDAAFCIPDADLDRVLGF